MSAALDWLAGAGWRAYFGDKGAPWDEWITPEAYRARHLTGSINALAQIILRRR